MQGAAISNFKDMETLAPDTAQKHYCRHRPSSLVPHAIPPLSQGRTPQLNSASHKASCCKGGSETRHHNTSKIRPAPIQESTAGSLSSVGYSQGTTTATPVAPRAKRKARPLKIRKSAFVRYRRFSQKGWGPPGGVIWVQPPALKKPNDLHRFNVLEAWNGLYLSAYLPQR